MESTRNDLGEGRASEHAMHDVLAKETLPSGQWVQVEGVHVSHQVGVLSDLLPGVLHLVGHLVSRPDPGTVHPVSQPSSDLSAQHRIIII